MSDWPYHECAVDAATHFDAMSFIDVYEAVYGRIRSEHFDGQTDALSREIARRLHEREAQEQTEPEPVSA